MHDHKSLNSQGARWEPTKLEEWKISNLPNHESFQVQASVQIPVRVHKNIEATEGARDYLAILKWKLAPKPKPIWRGKKIRIYLPNSSAKNKEIR